MHLRARLNVTRTPSLRKPCCIGQLAGELFAVTSDYICEGPLALVRFQKSGLNGGSLINASEPTMTTRVSVVPRLTE
jgi:hypothetical protein